MSTPPRIPPFEVLDEIDRAKKAGQYGRVAWNALCERYPWKQVMRAYEKLVGKDYLDYGVSLPTAFLTAKGEEYLNKLRTETTEDCGSSD